MREDSANNSEANSEEEGIIRCICGLDDDDGSTIQCEKCLVWQHMACFDIDEDNVPAHYFCEQCEPREVDIKKAKAQRRKGRKRKKGRRGKDEREEKDEDEFVAISEDYVPIKKNSGKEEDFKLVNKKCEEMDEFLAEFKEVLIGTVLRKKKVGLQVKEFILKNSFVCEIRGKLAKDEQLIKEAFVFPFYDNFVLDAREFGNEARFVRYSCKPNSEIKLIKNEGDLHLCIFSLTELKAGDEVLVSYNDLIGYKSGEMRDDRIASHCACDSFDSCSYRRIEDSSLSESEFEEIQLLNNQQSQNKRKRGKSSNDSTTNERKGNNTGSNNQANDDLFSKPDRLLSREERKIRDELMRFARMESGDSHIGNTSHSSSFTKTNTKDTNKTVNTSNSTNNSVTTANTDRRRKKREKSVTSQKEDDVDIVDDTDSHSIDSKNDTSNRNNNKKTSKENIYQFNWKQKMLWRYMEEVKKQGLNNDTTNDTKIITSTISSAQQVESTSVSPVLSVASSPAKLGIKRPAVSDDLLEETQELNHEQEQQVVVSVESSTDSVYTSNTNLNNIPDEEKPKEQTRISLKDYKKKRKIMISSNDTVEEKTEES